MALQRMYIRDVLYLHVGPPNLKRCVWISDIQRSVLLKSYSENAYPTSITYNMLSEQLGLTISKLKNWFHDHRRRVRKHKKTLPTGESICIHCVCCTDQFKTTCNYVLMETVTYRISGNFRYTIIFRNGNIQPQKQLFGKVSHFRDLFSLKDLC